MSKEIQFDPEDEEFFGSVGSFGVPKFDNEMTRTKLSRYVLLMSSMTLKQSWIMTQTRYG